MAKISLLLAAIAAVCLVEMAVAFLYVPQDEWESYKLRFKKNYPPIIDDYAKYYYAYNKKMIDKHNELFHRGLRTYTLEINQFSDMRFIHFQAMFPLAMSSEISPNKIEKLDLDLVTTEETFPSDDMKINFQVEDQGTKCNSGWAYATAKAVEIFHALNQYPIPDSEPKSLSAQNLIDCAGGWKACKNQIPLTAFEYLTKYKQKLHLNETYPNIADENHQGMCLNEIDVIGDNKPAELFNYYRIKDGDDETLAKVVASLRPVVVEFNPTSFEFMHYASGVFQQPTTHKGSHYMVVVGYGKELIAPNTEMKYWLLQNSFGPNWGEGGLIKVHRSSFSKIAKNAIYPSI